jgi:hypothetical protein
MPRTSVDSESLNLARNDSLWYGNFGSATAGQAISCVDNAFPALSTTKVLKPPDKTETLANKLDAFGPNQSLEMSALTEPSHEVESLSSKVANEQPKTKSPEIRVLSRFYEREEQHDGKQIDSWFGFDVPSESDDWEELGTERSILKSFQSPPPCDQSSHFKKFTKYRSINPGPLRSKVRSLSSLSPHSIKKSSSDSSRPPTRASSFQFRMMNGISNFACSLSTLSSKE